MKKLKLRGKLLSIALPIAVLTVIVMVFYSFEMSKMLSESKSLYYNQLYQVNSTLINADRDYYQAYTAMLQHESYSAYVDADTAAGYLSDYDENIQQTKERVDSVMTILADYEELSNYELDGKTIVSDYEDFNSNFEKMCACYDSKTGTADFENFDVYFNATREDISSMEDIVEAYATESETELQNSITKSIITFAIIVIVVLIIVLFITAKIIKYIQKNTENVTKNISYIADKDLTHPIDDLEGTDEIAQLNSAANSLRQQFLNVITSMKGSSATLSESSRIMSASTTNSAENINNIDFAASELATTATRTAQDIVEIADEIAEIDSMASESVNDTAVLFEACNSVKDITNTGMDTVNELSKVTEQNMEAFEKIFDAITGIDESTKTISSASDMITDIASQTNLLSLNASIEAARAGEAGKGFAVVADEIRLLAEQSASSASTITEMIDELQASAKNATDISGLVKEYVEKQRQSVVDTRSGFENIVENLDSMGNSVQKLKNVNETLGDKVNNISSLVETLSAASEENAATAQELSATTSTISTAFSELEETGKLVNSSAQELSNMVADYTVGE